MPAPARRIWFGTETRAQWTPAPAVGFIKHRERYSVELKYENGGGDVVSTYAWQTTYDANFPISDIRDATGIEAYSRYASGEYGTDYIRFVDPFYADTNLFSPRFAAPGLIERGWENWGASTPTFSNTSANVYGKPMRKATWTLTSAANAQSGKAFTFLVPPGFYLHMGVSGSATGTAQMAYLPLGGSASSMTLIADATAPAYNVTTAGGGSGTSVKVYQRRTSTAASTLTINGMWAVITDSSSPPAISRFMPGEGHEGLRFAGSDPIPVEYVYGPNKYVSMGGMRLAETEPWA